MGFYTLILLAGLQAIPKDLYEAAEMDGTRTMRVFRRITLPLLMPNLLVVIVLVLIRAVQIFDEVYVLTGGGPGTSTLYLTQYIYETGFATLLRNPGLAAAASILMGAVLVVLTLLQLGIAGAAKRREAAMSRAADFLFRRRGGKGWHWTDVVTWVWLVGGLFIMFGPAVWLVGSSFKSPAALAEFPPTILPYVTQKATVEGYDKPLDLYEVTHDDGSKARSPKCAASASSPDGRSRQTGRDRQGQHRQPNAGAQMAFALENYTEPFLAFRFRPLSLELGLRDGDGHADHAGRQFDGGVRPEQIRFPGPLRVMLLILATLMVPLSVIMVPLYSIVSALGLFNKLWGVILPTVATPTGVFMLRQYMLTIPDELIDAARMDKASEWQIYWRIILPLTAPALAVLAIFSVVWRWNDFLWPLIVLSRKELYTLQVGLSIYSGELNVQWHFILAMTVVTMIPVVLVFLFLQRFITTGIAGTGLK